MSRLGGLGGFTGVRIGSNALRAATMAGFVDTVVKQECDNNLETSAQEATQKMKEMILNQSCGLDANTVFTSELKGGAIPLFNSGQLVEAITYKLMDAKEADLGGGQSNTFSAAFVGILRNPTIIRESPGNLLGKYTPVSMYTIALNQVKGYTVTMPRTGIIKKVPRRDFRKKPLEEHKDRHKELMASGVSSAYTKLVRG